MVTDFILEKIGLKVGQVITKEDILNEKGFNKWSTLHSAKDGQQYIIRGIKITSFRDVQDVDLMVNKVETPNVKPFPICLFQLRKK